MNYLYYGDNLDILKRYVTSETVDLVYLDPPFNSSQDYNVIFQGKNGSGAGAQIKAFEDTWHWDQNAAREYKNVIEAGGQISIVMQSFRSFLGENDMMAYLVMMAPRLIELHRSLKSTGSLFLHCDPTASHYLKILLDAIFGTPMFINEIIWPRLTAAKSQTSGFGRTHDVILFYSKTADFHFNRPTRPLSDERMQKHYSNTEEGTNRRYMLSDFTQTGAGPSRRFGQRIIDPPSNKHWIWSQERIDEAMKTGRLVFTNPNVPRIKRYLDENKGDLVEDIWSDVHPINAMAKERLGYPTQKPEALLERIIAACSNEGDVVLDPFCGCGTAIAVAEKLKRKWMGIDITHLAISLMKHRLRDAFGENISKEYKVIGEPVDLDGAQELAQTDPYQFQWWALGLVGARPVEQKKGADKGIDGRLFFHDDESGNTKQMIFSVKAGQVHSSHIRDLNGVLDREKAEMGVLISMAEPTRNMVREASASDLYEAEALGKSFPKIQIITVEELLDGKKVAMPYHAPATFKKAEKHLKKDGEQTSMF